MLNTPFFKENVDIDDASEGMLDDRNVNLLFLISADNLSCHYGKGKYNYIILSSIDGKYLYNYFDAGYHCRDGVLDRIINIFIINNRLNVFLEELRLSNIIDFNKLYDKAMERNI